MTAAPQSPAPKRALSLGVIFLTLYIDLIGFSIIFPLGPDLLRHYLAVDGHSGALGWLLRHAESVARLLGNDSHLPEVLFGGLISSAFSILQFVFAPLWGGLSDRHGRRGILVWTVAGTALSYFLWAISGSFWLFLAARMLSGIFGGNLSVATAAVADVTSREERSKAMGLVGASFGLGLVTGPAIGGFSSRINLLDTFPGLAAWGINPFSVPALIAFGLSVVNFFWIRARFAETLAPENRTAASDARTRNPLRAILAMPNRAVRSINLVSFVYALAFVAMEGTLTFLAADHFGFHATDNAKLMAFLGVCSIITQGFIVRRLLGRLRETSVLTSGLVFSSAGFVCIGFAPSPAFLYLGVALISLGGGLVNPSTTGLISLYADAQEQGRVLGIFRSLGSLARAITPICAGLIYWSNREHGAEILYSLAGLMAVCALLLSTRLPQPHK
ncbi:MFS transporter [Nibricoccus sp. IMCC34717]|uniref:MFS transporter n=1 Tax=Nibricoccus sp. IMCC34717 TaxID=3034021 RepID=UPI00384C1411